MQQKFGRRRLHYPSIQLLYSFFAGRPPFCFCFRFYYLQSANGDKVYYSVPSPPPSTLSIPSPAHSYIVSYPFPPSVKTGHGIKLPVNSVIHLLVAAFLSSSWFIPVVSIFVVALFKSPSVRPSSCDQFKIERAVACCHHHHVVFLWCSSCERCPTGTPYRSPQNSLHVTCNIHHAHSYTVQQQTSHHPHWIRVHILYSLCVLPAYGRATPSAPSHLLKGADNLGQS